MRLLLILTALVLTGAARPQPGIPGTPQFPLRVAGTAFADTAGQPFPWRGITAFRLAEMIAGGREKEAVAYLDWVRSEQLTVVRVLLTAQHLFKLTPEAGRAALPRLLDLAKERGIAVEAVGLADSNDIELDYEAHIRHVGRVADEKGNAFVEIANEPGHHTQDVRLHDPAFAKRLADLLPERLIVALGSVEYGEGYAAGDYATFHFPRGRQPWDHVLALSDGARRVVELKKPIVSDEPIGAGPEYSAGRRDNEPSRFAAAAALTRFAGMAATFHYEGGLQAKIPAGREAACLAAWQTGLALLDDVTIEGEFLSGARAGSVVEAKARGVFARMSETRAVILLVDPAPAAPLELAPEWTDIRRAGVPGVQIVVVERR